MDDNTLGIEFNDDSEITSDSDKTEEEKNETPGKKVEDGTITGDDKKPNRSEVAQKIRYRERLRKAEARIAELEGHTGHTPPTTSKKNDSEDDKELAAQKYIREQARFELKEYLDKEKREEREALDAFEAKVDEILEDNPDISEKRLLDAIEKYSVSPDVAVKILKDVGTGKNTDVKKPSMPNPKRGGAVPETKKKDDAGKTMWQIAQELGRELKERAGT